MRRIAAGGAVAALAVAFVGAWEGLRLEAYRDLVGVPTICYGETRGVELGDTATREECDAMLLAGLIEFEGMLLRCIREPEVIPDEAWVAFVSWAYNVGGGAACGSTLVRLANAGDLVGACQQLPRWRYAGGREVRGLLNRRNAERRMCLEAVQ